MKTRKSAKQLRRGDALVNYDGNAKYRRFAWERMGKIDDLIRAEKYPNSVGMAQEFGVSVRTVKRDIEFMQVRRGLPIEYDAKRWGYYYSKPVDGFAKAPMTEAEVFAVLVAHNAPFDTSFLNHEISRVYPGHQMMNSHLCTVTLSRRTLPGLQNYRLDTIADHFGIQIFDRHRAGSDALATAKVFLRLLERLDEYGVRDLASARTFRVLDQQSTQAAPLIPGF